MDGLDAFEILLLDERHMCYADLERELLGQRRGNVRIMRDEKDFAARRRDEVLQDRARNGHLQKSEIRDVSVVYSSLTYPIEGTCSTTKF